MNTKTAGPYPLPDGSVLTYWMRLLKQFGTNEWEIAHGDLDGRFLTAPAVRDLRLEHHLPKEEGPVR